MTRAPGAPGAPRAPRVTSAALLAAIAGACLSNAAHARPDGTLFPSVIPLSSLDGAIGFRLDGVAMEDRSGRSVAPAGDVNGDGVDDFLVGAFRADPGGVSDAGSTYVVFGKNTASAGAFPATLSLATLTGTDGFRLDGVAAGDRSGYSVAPAGDVNGDGVDDLVIGVERASPGGVSAAGATYVVFGKNTALAGAFPATLALASLDGSNGFRLDGVAANDASGISVAAAGDVNGDGVDDLVIGAFRADPGGRDGAGSTYVVFGKDTASAGAFPATLALASLNGSNGFRLDGVAAYDISGSSVFSAGDINADGVVDVVIGARGADPGGRDSAGSTYVVFGKNTAVAGAFPATLALASLNGSNGFRLDGVAAGDSSGSHVARAGDVNGDGVVDVVIGARSADPGGINNAGSTYVVFGKNTASAGAFPATLALASLDGANGFRLDGVAASDSSGSVAPAGDVNGDGVDDVVIGANGADPGGLSGAGSTYVVFGKDTASAGAFPATLALASLDGVNGFRLDGAAADDSSGRTVAPAGDINGDGVDDVVISAHYADPGGVSGVGSTYIVYGRVPPCEGDTNGDNVVDFIDLNNVLSAFGVAMGQPGFLPGADLNHDNVVDFLDLNIVLSFFGTAC